MVFDEANFDDALMQAVENQESSYIEDVLEEIASSSFEINLSGFYPTWPDEVEIGDQKIMNILNSVINKNKKKFNIVKKLYFDHVDNFDFIKIIDNPTLKNDSKIETDEENVQSTEDNLHDIDEVKQKLSLEREAWDLIHSKQ